MGKKLNTSKSVQRQESKQNIHSNDMWVWWNIYCASDRAYLFHWHQFRPKIAKVKGPSKTETGGSFRGSFLHTCMSSPWYGTFKCVQMARHLPKFQHQCWIDELSDENIWKHMKTRENNIQLLQNNSNISTDHVNIATRIFRSPNKQTSHPPSIASDWAELWTDH